MNKNGTQGKWDKNHIEKKSQVLYTRLLQISSMSAFFPINCAFVLIVFVARFGRIVLFVVPSRMYFMLDTYILNIFPFHFVFFSLFFSILLVIVFSVFRAVRRDNLRVFFVSPALSVLLLLFFHRRSGATRYKLQLKNNSTKLADNTITPNILGASSFLHKQKFTPWIYRERSATTRTQSKHQTQKCDYKNW